MSLLSKGLLVTAPIKDVERQAQLPREDSNPHLSPCLKDRIIRPIWGMFLFCIKELTFTGSRHGARLSPDSKIHVHSPRTAHAFCIEHSLEEKLEPRPPFSQISALTTRLQSVSFSHLLLLSGLMNL